MKRNAKMDLKGWIMRPSDLSEANYSSVFELDILRVWLILQKDTAVFLYYINHINLAVSYHAPILSTKIPNVMRNPIMKIENQNQEIQRYNNKVERFRTRSTWARYHCLAV